VNVSQPGVNRHLVDTPQSSTQVRYRKVSASTSENPDALVLGNHETSTGIREISINYTSSREVYDCSTTIVNPCFLAIIADNFLADPNPKTMAECKGRLNWNKWKEAVEDELNSLKKRNVFTEVIPTPFRIFPVGFKWVFIQKRNENNEVVRYKVRLVAQGFTQRPDIDFNETYSPIINGCRDRIIVWVIRFEYIHESFRWNSCSEYARKSQHVLCKAYLVIIRLETIRKDVVQSIKRVPPKYRLL
jgi:hypothetical protein